MIFILYLYIDLCASRAYLESSAMYIKSVKYTTDTVDKNSLRGFLGD